MAYHLTIKFGMPSFIRHLRVLRQIKLSNNSRPGWESRSGAA